MFTVKQLSKLTGVTARTLHYYDEIGLLKPSRIGANGYRYYGQEPLLRLQQILFYRDLDVPLAEILAIMDRPDFDVLAALEGHKAALARQAARLGRLIRTVDNTIDHLKGTQTMTSQGLFAGFNDAEQQKYQQEAEQKYDAETVRASNRKWKSYGAAKQQAVRDEGDAVYRDMVTAMPHGAASAQVQAIVQRWRDHLEYFWTPTLEALSGLARTYTDDPRFKANFDKLDPRLADFMVEAVAAYVAAH